MARRLFRLMLVMCVIGMVCAADPSDYVKLFNPNILAGADAAPMTSTFGSPGSDIAAEVNHSFWYTLLVFSPFLILPQILLLVVIFKFKDRGVGHKAATWVHNTKLEIVWTAIPVVALIIAGIPAFPLLYKMELPPTNIDSAALQVTVTGHQYAWDYDYKHEGVQLGVDLVSSQQESLVLPVNRTVALSITSNDVNHAWWVPAFGVKKDAIMGRYNSCWFTPDKTGFYKGQCAELCGALHGRMIIGASVVEPEQFVVWVSLQRYRVAAQKVWGTMLVWNAGEDDAILRDVIAGYREKVGSTPEADFALRYWIAHNGTSLERAAPAAPKDDPTFLAWQANLSKLVTRENKVVEILTTFKAQRPNQEALVVASVQE